MYHSALQKLPLNKLVIILVVALGLIAPEFALAEGGPPTPSLGQIVAKMIPMLIMVFFIFYFMVIKPQQIKLKAHDNMIKALKKGDKVVTAAGIIGRVADIADDGISVEIAPNVKVKFLASKVSKKIETEEASKKAA
jgi:preprotein translocase subunit YajC